MLKKGTVTAKEPRIPRFHRGNTNENEAIAKITGTAKTEKCSSNQG
jgi:hypothetical protein